MQSDVRLLTSCREAAIEGKMAIPYKLFMKLQDKEIEAHKQQSFLEVEEFMAEIGWPWRASLEQLNEWSQWMRNSGLLDYTNPEELK